MLNIKIDDNKIEEFQDDYLIIAIDSTGIKITNRGRWMKDKWKAGKKGYLKIHIVVNVKTKKILSMMKVLQMNTFTIARRYRNWLKRLQNPIK